MHDRNVSLFHSELVNILYTDFSNSINFPLNLTFWQNIFFENKVSIFQIRLLFCGS